jgi:aminopeptidase-like protein
VVKKKNLNTYYNLGKKVLFPICRSITGDGIRKTLSIIKKEFKELKIYQIKSGKKVFDWKIPYEWNISESYVTDINNKKIIDFKNNNLHVVGYSYPIKKKIDKKTLLKKIHTSSKLPNAIPYVTSYYKKYWGFCTTKIQKDIIKRKYKDSSKFNILIKSKIKKRGVLNWGELVLKGETKQEILISTYVCHPSMANNELSGPIVAMALINNYKKKKLNKSIRFVFIPETIGSITYIKKNIEKLKKNIIGGYNLTCIGDDKNHSCIFSKYKNSPSDYALKKAYKKLRIKYKSYSFLHRGSDERQYNSPGIDLKITSIFRSKYNEYPEYHTSLDNFDLVTKKGINGGYKVAKTAIDIMLATKFPKTRILCEPQMSKRGLYSSLSNNKKNYKSKKIMDFIQYSDGTNSIEEISKIIKLDIKKTNKIEQLLKKNKII